jgi:hypothetical protein
MKLGKYLKDKNVSDFANEVGVTTAAVYHWLSGLRHPRRKQALRIIKVSDGAVTLEDLLG